MYKAPATKPSRNTSSSQTDINLYECNIRSGLLDGTLSGRTIWSFRPYLSEGAFPVNTVVREEESSYYPLKQLLFCFYLYHSHEKMGNCCHVQRWLLKSFKMSFSPQLHKIRKGSDFERMTLPVRLPESWRAGFWVRGGDIGRQMAGDKLRGTKDGLAASGTPFS